MAKVFGIAVVLVALWIGMTIYTEGAERAFGGMFASLGSSPDEERSGSVLERVRTRVGSDIEEGARRRGYDDAAQAD